MKRWIIGLLALTLAFGAASAQTLIYGQSDLPKTLDSADAQDGNSLRVAFQITETLVTFKPGTVDPIPGLAVSWQASDNAKVWTFKLRQGVKFQDGTPFDAAAVKFNIDRWNDPNNKYRGNKQFVPFTWVFGGFKGKGSIIDRVEVVDDYTVKFYLTNSVGFFPNMLGASYFGIDSPKAVMANPDKYGTPEVGAVGTGPFVFDKWIIGDKVILKRNDNYWGEKAKVDTLVFRGIPEPASRLAELKAGSIDIANNLSPEDKVTIDADPNLQAVVQKGLNIGYLAFHQKNKPLDDIRVRKAIAAAVDWNAIVDAFYAGLGEHATEFVPPAMWGRDGHIPAYTYNPKLAKKLLAEAGYPNGFQTEIWYMPVSRPYFPAPQPIAETIATYLADVGIKATLKTEDWGTYLSDYDQGKFPMYMLGWSPDYPDPDNYLYTFFGPTSIKTNLGCESEACQQIGEMLVQARTAPDMATRKELYAKVQRMVHELVLSIPVAHNNPLHAVRKGVKGWVPSPLGSSENLNLVTVNK